MTHETQKCFSSKNLISIQGWWIPVWDTSVHKTKTLKMLDMAYLSVLFSNLSVQKSWNRLGWGKKDHQVQPVIQHYTKYTTNPGPVAPSLHIFNILPWMMNQPPPWAKEHFTAWKHTLIRCSFWKYFPEKAHRVNRFHPWFSSSSTHHPPISAKIQLKCKPFPAKPEAGQTLLQKWHFFMLLLLSVDLFSVLEVLCHTTQLVELALLSAHSQINWWAGCRWHAVPTAVTHKTKAGFPFCTSNTTVTGLSSEYPIKHYWISHWTSPSKFKRN